MVSCDFIDDHAATVSQHESQAEPNSSSCLKTLPGYIVRFTLLAGNLLLEGSKKSNFVLSPLNIFHAFSLLHTRSVGETKSELCSIFGFPDDLETTNPEGFHQKFEELFQLLQMSRNITFHTVTKMLPNTKSRITTNFSENTKPVYITQHSKINSSETTATSCINDSLISQLPNVQIKTTVPKFSITDDKFFIISALHFKGQLEKEFSGLSIKRETFHTRFSNTSVDMMSQQQRVQYLDDPKFKFRILGLPYKNRHFSLYIQLPRDDPKCEDFSNNFDAVYLSSFVDFSSLDKRLVHYKIPRFQAATISDLRDVLVKFGSHNIMTSPMLDMLDGSDIDLVDAKHEASFEFTETDAESNARLSCNESLIPPVNFIVNKPFAFFVYYHPMKIILLAGVISKPSY